MMMYCVDCGHRWDTRDPGEKCPNCEPGLPLSGEERRDAGMASVEANNETWNKAAYQAAFNVALEKEYFTVDDLSHFTMKPTHPNAFGPLWRKMKAHRVIEETGQMRKSKSPQKHARRVPVYRSLVFRRK